MTDIEVTEGKGERGRAAIMLRLLDSEELDSVGPDKDDQEDEDDE
ncbi:hypothetical protein [Streptomyces sp. NPDC059009]